jgi:type I restriction enzyme S subunit
MSEWRECKLGDILEIKYGKDHKKLNDGIIPVYGSGGIMRYADTSLYDEESILIPRKGTLNNIFYINKPFWTVDTLFYTKPNKSLVNIKFLYYQLSEIDFNALNVGSAVPSLTVSVLNDVLIDLPELPEQKAIAAVLSSLDDKIDLLHRQNKSLEAMAETLFKQWFVVEAREDWEFVTIGDFVTTNEKTVNNNYDQQFIEYLDTSSLTEGKINGIQLLSLKEAPSRAKRLVKHNDVLISTVRPNQKHFGIIKNPKNNLVVSTGFCVLTCHKIDPYFIYILLTTDEMTEYLHSIAEGSTSTYPSLKPSDIEKIEFQLPPKNKLDEFAKIASDNWNKIAVNHNQIQTLETLRDNLLPKLMSGEVRVNL